MNLRRLGEKGFLDQVRRRFHGAAPPPPAGPGDDAALLFPRSPLAVTTDCLVEGRHFLRGEPAFLLGRKALAVNLSDLAAMGARPLSFLLDLVIPDGLPGRWLESMLDGMASAARASGATLIGGDTCRGRREVVISITLLGTLRGAGRGGALTRAGARPGDGIYVSGALGASAAGRLLLAAGGRARLDRSGRRLVGVSGGPAGRRSTYALEALRAHLDPPARIDLGRRLARDRVASAAIDLSDGLSTDLSRLAEASGVGARVSLPAIPIADAARHLGPLLSADPLSLALDGGEDYELLFTAPPSRERLTAAMGALWIGRIVSRRLGLTLAGPAGRARTLRAGGFDHFH